MLCLNVYPIDIFKESAVRVSKALAQDVRLDGTFRMSSNLSTKLPRQGGRIYSSSFLSVTILHKAIDKLKPLPCI